MEQTTQKKYKYEVVAAIIGLTIGAIAGLFDLFDLIHHAISVVDTIPSSVFRA